MASDIPIKRYRLSNKDKHINCLLNAAEFESFGFVNVKIRPAAQLSMTPIDDNMVATSP